MVLLGHHSKSKYYLTNKKRELEYYHEKADYLLKKASPLMDIYTENNINAFNEFMDKEKRNRKNSIKEINNSYLNGTFKNIDFTVCSNNWVMISKKSNPEIHFVIHHPILRNAIENFVVPVIEN